MAHVKFAPWLLCLVTWLASLPLSAHCESNASFLEKWAPATPYPERVKMLEDLAAEYGLGEKMCPAGEDPPGMVRVEKYRDSRLFGIWGAHFVNSNRQAETGRDKFSIWSFSNFGQVVIPSRFGKEFKEGIACEKSPTITEFTNSPVPGPSGTEIGLNDVCWAWHRFFKLSRTLKNQPKLTSREKELFQHYFWAAHSLSNFHTWVLSAKRFADDRDAGLIPTAEVKTFNGYARYVSSALPKANSSSCSAAMWPYLDEAIPPCIQGSEEPCKQLEYRLGNSVTQRGINRLAAMYLKTYRTSNFEQIYRSLEYEVRHYKRETAAGARPHGEKQAEEARDPSSASTAQ